MRLRILLTKLISSFLFVVFSAMLLGLITGGYPAYTDEISMITLVTAMIFSLSLISTKGILKRDNLKFAFYAVVLNFGLLSLSNIAIGFLFEERFRYGFVMIASVPAAIAVVPLSRILKGKLEHAFVSISLIYLLSFVFTPLYIITFMGRELDISRLGYDIFLFIVLPLILSRVIRRVKISDEISRIIVNVCFFLLIFGIMGKNRYFLFYGASNLIILSIVLLSRSYGLGLLVYTLGKRLKVDDEKLIPLSLFSVFKNDGMAVLLCISLLPQDISYIAAIPCTLSIVFEMGWAGYLESRLRKDRKALSDFKFLS